eukprot:3748628-Rhodomonas_salina.3
MLRICGPTAPTMTAAPSTKSSAWIIEAEVPPGAPRAMSARQGSHDIGGIRRTPTKPRTMPMPVPRSSFSRK